MPSELQHAAAEAITAFRGFINAPTLLDLARRFSLTYANLARSSTEHFLVTPVTALPTGKEKGRFLSIDVGGTNLRVGFIELVGEIELDAEAELKNGSHGPAKIKRSHDRSWPIEDHLKMDQAEDLFAWIGDCIAEVVRMAVDDGSLAIDDAPAPSEILLGITFSFPMAQTRLSEATLLPMGKGFAITSDLNLGKMLLAGYARHCSVTGQEENIPPPTKKSKLSPLPPIRVAAITNDTVATFASLAYAVKAAPNSRVAMGLIVGTGTNATVPMTLDSLHPAKRKELANPEAVETVVINTEWTIRGTDQPLIDLNIKTSWDLTLDANSEAPGFQPFEYMTAGRYLGEIVRLVIVDLVSQHQPSTSVPPSLLTKNALPTRFLSEVVARTDPPLLSKTLESHYPSTDSTTPFWTLEMSTLLRDIAFAVQQRSSALIAAACVGLLHCVGDISLDSSSSTPTTSSITTHPPQNGTHLPHTAQSAAKPNQVPSPDQEEELVIAYAGGTISQYPAWRATCQRWIDELIAQGSQANSGKRVRLREALDGGIVGAGVLAGVAGEIV